MSQKMKLLPPPERVVVDTHIPTGVRIYAYDAATLSDYARANVEHHTAGLRYEVKTLRDLCAAAYQMAGVHDAPVEWLDALSNAANGRPFSTDGLLPYMPKSVCDAEARAERLAEALQWYVDNDDTNDGQEGNEYWLAGRDRAIALLREQEAPQ